MEHTLAIIKPNAVKTGYTGRVLSRIEDFEFTMEAIRLLQLSTEDAEEFYAVHQQRPFFPSLIEFMSSGPIVPLVLQKTDAVTEFRKAIGATDPEEAGEGTIRRLYGESKERNTIHGSDSNENARIEIEFFFPGFFASI
ncbi:MAG TPA: nucleoside-diphosphate kinase [Gemmatimonadetes bacterium]|nr:nucleoside-diphosphate kinase [Gemmatimonadota bacterium]